MRSWIAFGKSVRQAHHLTGQSARRCREIVRHVESNAAFTSGHRDNRSRNRPTRNSVSRCLYASGPDTKEPSAKTKCISSRSLSVEMETELSEADCRGCMEYPRFSSHRPKADTPPWQSGHAASYSTRPFLALPATVVPLCCSVSMQEYSIGCSGAWRHRFSLSSSRISDTSYSPCRR